MIASIKSEFRKMFSIRSTYIVLILGFLVVGPLFGFYGSGWQAGEGVNFPEYMTSVALNSAAFISIFVAIVALLAVTHEYRYNTIMYTLTSSNSRTKTLAAKMLVIFIMSLAATALAVIIAQVSTRLGIEAKGLEIVPQSFDYLSVTWRTLFFGTASALFAAILAVLIRNQVGAIITYFIVINSIEGLIGQFILKHNAKWLPSTSLQHVINTTDPQAVQQIAANQGHWWPAQAALLFTVYIVLLGILAWFLFRRRDAS